MFGRMSAVSGNAPCTALNHRGLGTSEDILGSGLLLVALPEDPYLNFYNELISTFKSGLETLGF